jgi:hypothetical protein
VLIDVPSDADAANILAATEEALRRAASTGSSTMGFQGAGSGGAESVERRACTVFTRGKVTPASNPTRKPTRNYRRIMASNATRSTLTDGDSTG